MSSAVCPEDVRPDGSVAAVGLASCNRVVVPVVVHGQRIDAGWRRRPSGDRRVWPRRDWDQLSAEIGRDVTESLNPAERGTAA